MATSINLNMLEALGKEFQSQHVRREYRRLSLEKSYRAYVTDALKVMGENVAKLVGGSYINVRWMDCVESGGEPKETRTPEEVVNGIRQKLKEVSE